jgi:hypothetical protein
MGGRRQQSEGPKVQRRFAGIPRKRARGETGDRPREGPGATEPHVLAGSRSVSPDQGGGAARLERGFGSRGILISIKVLIVYNLF